MIIELIPFDSSIIIPEGNYKVSNAFYNIFGVISSIVIGIIIGSLVGNYFHINELFEYLYTLTHK